MAVTAQQVQEFMDAMAQQSPEQQRATMAAVAADPQYSQTFQQYPVLQQAAQWAGVTPVPAPAAQTQGALSQLATTQGDPYGTAGKQLDALNVDPESRTGREESQRNLMPFAYGGGRGDAVQLGAAPDDRTKGLYANEGAQVKYDPQYGYIAYMPNGGIGEVGRTIANIVNPRNAQSFATEFLTESPIFKIGTMALGGALFPGADAAIEAGAQLPESYWSMLADATGTNTAAAGTMAAQAAANGTTPTLMQTLTHLTGTPWIDKALVNAAVMGATGAVLSAIRGGDVKTAALYGAAAGGVGSLVNSALNSGNDTTKNTGGDTKQTNVQDVRTTGGIDMTGGRTDAHGNKEFNIDGSANSMFDYSTAGTKNFNVGEIGENQRDNRTGLTVDLSDSRYMANPDGSRAYDASGRAIYSPGNDPNDINNTLGKNYVAATGAGGDHTTVNPANNRVMMDGSPNPNFVDPNLSPGKNYVAFDPNANTKTTKNILDPSTWTPSDWGALGSGILGYKSASDRLDFDKQRYGDTAASRARFDASMAPTFDLRTQTGYGGALSQLAKDEAAKWSTVVGNPAGSPGAQTSMLDTVWNRGYVPMLNNYQSQNANVGFGANATTAGNSVSGSIAGPNNAIQGTLGALTAPQPASVDELLQQLNKQYGSALAGLKLSTTPA